MDRVPDFESVGCGFESRRGRLYMADYQSEEYLIELLLIRLERITADSTLAHKASGIRGALIRQLDAFRFGKPVDSTKLKRLIDSGFDIVKSAALK
jgi:hypothetical protein